MFELTHHDAAGRLSKWTINGKTIKLPEICIVVNPNRMSITPKEIKEKFGAQIIITNSYIIKKYDELRERATKEKLHKFLDFDGPIYTDSGTFQYYSQGIDNIDPQEIVEFQKKIGSEIITPLDAFTLPTDDRKTAKKKLELTIKRIREARRAVHEPHLLNGPIQGGIFLDLRARAARAVAKENPDVFSIGGIVPLMEQYRFSDLVDVIITCKQNLPTNKPVHAFGAGHPMVFALLAAAGCDLFDSAMYSIAAKRGAYLTVRGTYQLKEMSEFPCACPECAATTPEKIKSLPRDAQEKFLASHNLWVTMSEIRTVRQAIREQSLWELVQERARAHPKLLEALVHMLAKYKQYFLERDPITKSSSLMYCGEETSQRPEILRALQKLRSIKGKTFTKHPFGKVPIELASVYPFGQSVGFGEETRPLNPDVKKSVPAVLDYQYGKGASKLFGKIQIEVSKESGRAKRVNGGGRMLGTFRPHDGYFIPSMDGARLLLKRMKTVTIKDKEVVQLVAQGKNLMAKYIHKADESILPGEEIAIIDSKGILVATGSAKLTGKEIMDFKRGIAVETRHHSEKSEKV